MRKAVVDGHGHLHLVYWQQNDLAKGGPLEVSASHPSVAYPPGDTPSTAILRLQATKDSVEIAPDKNWRQFPWLNGAKSRKAVVQLDNYFDLDKGVIVAGKIRASALNPAAPFSRKMYAGFFIEGIENGPGTAILLEVGEPQWRESVIGELRLGSDFHLEPLDRTGRYSATVTGLDNGVTHTFRLWLRGGQMELYIDDQLMQSFFVQRPTGRIGLITQEADTLFSDLRFHEMNFNEWPRAEK